MTNIDINLLYKELSILLEDICCFLHDELRDGKLTPKAQHEANQLIQRSKMQLTTIAKVSTVTDNESGKYVDMNPIKANSNVDLTDDSNQIYSAIDEPICEPQSFIETSCPYDLTPATDVPAGAKCGYLEKKERIFFIGLQKKFYAFAYQNWMVMYYSKKDSKPITTLNLTQYEAKKLEGPKDKKEMFQLSCLNDQTKTYIFTASTEKDALQWIAVMNKHLFMTKTIDLKVVKAFGDPEHEPNETVDVIPNKYIQIKSLIPDLPPRKVEKPLTKPWDPRIRPVPNIPTIGIITNSNVDETETSISNSFSDVDSNASYDEVITKANYQERNVEPDEQTIEYHEDTEYDEVLNPPITDNLNEYEKAEDKLITIKPKLRPKPNLKSFLNH